MSRSSMIFVRNFIYAQVVLFCLVLEKLVADANPRMREKLGKIMLADLRSPSV